jgi:hypothetical protein
MAATCCGENSEFADIKEGGATVLYMAQSLTSTECVKIESAYQLLMLNLLIFHNTFSSFLFKTQAFIETCRTNLSTAASVW